MYEITTCKNVKSMGVFDVDFSKENDNFEHDYSTSTNIICEDYFPEDLKQIDDSELSLMHLNIRSIKKHHDDLISLLASTGCNFDIIGCTETWMNEYTISDVYNLEGYMMYYNNRSGKNGGGVCLYVNNHCVVEERNDMIMDDGCSDSLFLEVKTLSGPSIIIGVIYRPPSSVYNTFRVSFDNLLLSINQHNKKCIIMGDFNIDTSKNTLNAIDFQNILFSSSFLTTIDRHTRVTKKTKTTIDNIITNIQSSSWKSGILYTDISDHYGIVFFTNFILKKSCSSRGRKTKILNNKTLTKLIQYPQTKKWDAIYCTSDPNKQNDSRKGLKTIKQKQSLAY